MSRAYEQGLDMQGALCQLLKESPAKQETDSIPRLGRWGR